MRGAGLTIFLLLLTAIMPRPAAGHPMGNFSVNHYASIRIWDDTLSIRYLLDFAEIPSVPLIKQIDRDGDELITAEEREVFVDSLLPYIENGIELKVDGVPLPLLNRFRNIHLIEGEGGLFTVVVGLDWVAGYDPVRAENTGPRLAEYTDRNYLDRPGWKEIRIDGEENGTRLLRASIDPGDPTEGLTTYPEEYRENPPDEDHALFYFGDGEAPPFPGTGEKGTFAKRETNRYADLLTRRGSPFALAGALGLALLFGALHAVEPGHGKTLVAAYLVGSKGTIGQALLLGLVVTITHTLSVFLLGLVTLFASDRIMPDRLYPYLALVSGTLVLVIGLVLFRSAFRALKRGTTDHGHHHHHGRGGDDHHHHHHSVTDESASLGQLLILGITGGLVPCPSALVVLLGAVALGRIAFGLALILAFSLGLALVLMGIAVLFVVARPLVERLTIGEGAFRWLRLASSGAITIIGAIILYHAFFAVSY